MRVEERDLARVVVVVGLAEADAVHARLGPPRLPVERDVAERRGGPERAAPGPEHEVRALAANEPRDAVAVAAEVEHGRADAVVEGAGRRAVVAVADAAAELERAALEARGAEADV